MEIALLCRFNRHRPPSEPARQATGIPHSTYRRPCRDVTQFVLYSKPGCHLCEGLEEKLVAAAHLAFELEVRDITTRDDWFQRYQYEIPVLCQVIQGEAGSQEMPLPRLSPRAHQARVEQLIQTYMGQSTAE